MRRHPAIALAAALAAAVSALSGTAPAGARALCEPRDAVAVAASQHRAVTYTEEPGAGRWRTWIVEPQDIAVAPPPALGGVPAAVELADVKLAVATRGAATLEAIRRWGAGAATAPWTALFLDLTKRYSAYPERNPPRISRQIAMLHAAMFDALVATWNAKYCHLRPPPSKVDPTIAVHGPAADAPSYPSEHAAVAGAAAVLLASFFPEEPEGSFDALQWEAGMSRVSAGANYRSDVTAGIVLGRSVAKLVLDARATDGWNASWDGSPGLGGTCGWSPVSPVAPVEPMWGKVRPWLMSTGSQLRPGAPPACDSPAYLAAARDVYEASLTLTQRQRDIATSWAGGPGTETPPGMNARIALETASAAGLSTMRHARVMAHVGAALADAAIAAWDAKFTYGWDRPIQTIRRLWDPQWTPLLPTPPFPGYVSGHATFSGATARVLGFFFPSQSGVFRALATEAALSRFYGGIHARYDNDAGLTVGEAVAELAVARAGQDRA